MSASVTLHNNTQDTFEYYGSSKHPHDHPQTINPGDKAVIYCAPGTPTVLWYQNGREGQVVVEVGNASQGNKIFGEGAYQVRMEGLAEQFTITKGNDCFYLMH